MKQFLIILIAFGVPLAAQQVLPGGAPGSSGSGTVTSITGGCGLSGGTITTSGTLARSELVNAQTGTSYTYLTGDCGKLVVHSNSGAIAGTLPQAGSAGFLAGWFMDVENTGTGTLTITPTTSTINGAATLVLTTNQGARIVSDGTNYQIQSGIGGGSSALVPGTTSVTGGTTQQLLYDNAGTLGEITKGNSCVYLTNGSGVPSCGTALPNGVTATTQTAGDNSTKLATTAYADADKPTTNQNIRPISITFDAGGVALTGTVSRCAVIPFGGTIQSVTLASDVSGSATVDVQTVAYSSYTGPSSAASITASDIPALSSAVKFQDSTLTGWTTSLSANTAVCFVLSSPSTVSWVSAVLKVVAN